MRFMPFAVAASCLALACLTSAAGPAHAMSLRVAPVLLEVPSPASATAVTVINQDRNPISVQIRVFRWTQEGGEERLEPTADVVASPPMTSLAPGAEYAVRIVRVAKRPVVDEESYRLVIDELPDRARQKPGTVTFTLRHSIPVFFAGPQAGEPKVAWSLQRTGRGLAVTAANAGRRRLRVADLKLKSRGAVRPLGSGLVGYVLGGSTATWNLAGGDLDLAAGAIRLLAQTDGGPIDVAATLGQAR